MFSVIVFVEAETMADKVAKRSRLQSKKSIKHLLERQRRARINNSLNELKHLVLSAIHQGNPQADLNGSEKMEKAEILELTVNYIKAIRGYGNPGVWKSEHKSSGRKRSESCYKCCGETEKKAKVKKSKRNVTHPCLSAYGSRPLSHVNCHVPTYDLCVDGKVVCSCYGSAVYGISTPPPSPSFSREYATPYEERTEVRAATMDASVSPRIASSKAGQVWRPWLE